MSTHTEPARRGRGSRPGQARGLYAKTEKTHEVILDAALGVFAEGGFRAGSLREIASRAGMSEAGLLHHFPNKPTLLEAVLRRRDLHSYELAPFDTMSGEAAIRGLIALAAFNASTPGVVELYCTLAAEATTADHPAHAYFVRRYERTRAMLTESFQVLQNEGRLAPGQEPDRAARATVALWDGLQVQWLLDRTSLDMAEELRAFLRLVTTLDL